MTIHKRPHTNRTNGPVSARGEPSSTRRSSGARNATIKKSTSARGENPKAHFDRYIKLAEAAATQGEKVDAQNYYQHAEHYFRTMKFDKTEE